jgi:hypothetical protein
MPTSNLPAVSMGLMRFTISLFRNIEGLPPERIRHDLKLVFNTTM